MQTNMKKHGAIKSRRNKTLVLAMSAGLAVLALVSGTTAQPAPAPANATNTARNNVSDMITDGLTDGRVILAVNKTAVITTNLARIGACPIRSARFTEQREQKDRAFRVLWTRAPLKRASPACSRPGARMPAARGQCTIPQPSVSRV